MKIRFAMPHRAGRALVIALIVGQAGCATWHEDTMAPRQLVAADCRALAEEEAKLASNAKHASQTSYFSAASAMLTAVASGLAGGDSRVNESANQQAESAGGNEKLAQELEQRMALVRELRSRKGCP